MLYYLSNVFKGQVCQKSNAQWHGFGVFICAWSLKRDNTQMLWHTCGVSQCCRIPDKKLFKTYIMVRERGYMLEKVFQWRNIQVVICLKPWRKAFKVTLLNIFLLFDVHLSFRVYALANFKIKHSFHCLLLYIRKKKGQTSLYNQFKCYCKGKELFFIEYIDLIWITQKCHKPPLLRTYCILR